MDLSAFGLWGRCNPCKECRSEVVELVTASPLIPSLEFLPGRDDQKVQHQQVLDALQGNWYTLRDGRRAATVAGDMIEVKTNWLPDLAIFQIPESTTDTLFIDAGDGFIFLGRISFETQHSIQWSNGEVWLKK